MLIICKECNRKVDAKELAAYKYHDRAEGPPTILFFLSCPRCEHGMLVRQREIWEESWSDPEVVFPSDDSNVTLNPELPDRLQMVMQEIRRCYQAKAYTATAMLCRKAIETLCADRGVKERNLSASLEKLRQAALIDGSLFEWADGLRLVGNRAAHDIESEISGEDARDIVEFTEALLEYVIVFRERFQRFKERQAKASTKKSGA